LTWVIFFIGIIYKEQATCQFYEEMSSEERNLYKSILDVINKKFNRYYKFIKALTKIKVKTKKEASEKLEQIQRIANKLIGDNND